METISGEKWKAQMKETRFKKKKKKITTIIILISATKCATFA